MGQRKKEEKALRILFATVAFLVVYQILHLIDHIAQYVQRYVYGIWPAPALFEGLLNASDTTIHLWLNAIEYAAFIVLLFSFKESQLKNLSKLHPSKVTPLAIATATILFLVGFQSIHVIDHIAQYIQYYTFGMDPAPGVFQGVFNETDTVVHLYVNGAIILAVFAVWASLGKLNRWKIINPVVFNDAERADDVQKPTMQ
jgi:hypothetical protein